MKKNPQMPSARRILGMVVGIVIIGLGIALFKQSHLGNDSISALNMRLAEMLGISLGVQNLCTVVYAAIFVKDVKAAVHDFVDDATAVETTGEVLGEDAPQSKPDEGPKAP